MHRAWTPPARWIFLVATLLGLFSTAQAYRLSTLNPRMRPEYLAIPPLLALNLALWYVPAALTRPIFWLAARFPLDSPRWLRAVAIHAGAAVAFSFIHSAAMIAVRGTLWPELVDRPWPAFLAWAQSSYLTNLDWALMTYAAIVGLSYAISYYRESQARALTAANLETRLMEARLKTLEAELHPHFLFNTLHAISTLVHSDPEAADRMISRLSDLLRLTFDRSGAAQIPLKEELEFLQKYLQIEQIRFQDRLSVNFDIDPETLDVEVPRLILQPLVENAIKHGISPRSGDGLVQISARRQAQGVWIEVKDNGVGLVGNARVRFTNGVGLSNTRARLECLYGDAHRLDFAEGDAGLSVRMLIPHQRMPNDALAPPAQVA
ncbi:MAG: sensor histidine kinase [Burkholderiales bacterium]